MKVFFTGQAHRDIAGIKSYISEKSPNAAKRIAGHLYDEAKALINSPLKGVSLSAKFGIETDLRMWIVSPNLILYKVTEDKIIVTRIVGEKTDYLAAIGLAKRSDIEDDT